MSGQQADRAESGLFEYMMTVEDGPLVFSALREIDATINNASLRLGEFFLTHQARSNVQFAGKGDVSETGDPNVRMCAPSANGAKNPPRRGRK